jgi:hypothetical protein
LASVKPKRLGTEVQPVHKINTNKNCL